MRFLEPPVLEIPLRKGSPSDVALASMHAARKVQPFCFRPVADVSAVWARWRAEGCLAFIVDAVEEGDARRYCLIDVFG